MPQIRPTHAAVIPGTAAARSQPENGSNCEDFPQSLQNLTGPHGFGNDNSVTLVVVRSYATTFRPVGLSGLRDSSFGFARVRGRVSLSPKAIIYPV